MRSGIFTRGLILGLALLVWAGVAPTSSAAGEEALPQTFNIPAGAAERTLTIFSRQSRQVAIFPTDLLEDVRTQSVRGDYTPLEALSLMLAGTTLLPAYDETTGALVVRAQPGARQSRVVELPPYVVETTIDTVRWSYAAVPGVEVISRCSEATTIQLLYHHFRLNDLLAVILPDEFRVKQDVPTTYVLYDQANQPGLPRELLREVRKRQDGAGLDISGLANYRFRDRDAVAIFFIINEVDFKEGRVSLTADYVRYMLESRTPALPAWFIEGLMDVYGSTHLESINEQAVRTSATLGDVSQGSFQLRPAVWISETETQAVKKNPRQRREFLPLGTLFGPLPPAPGDAAPLALWRSQAALFIRWALQGGAKDSRRAALWEFVRRTSREPATETMFRECFGLDYAAMEKQLRDYLPVAVKATVYLRTEKLFDPPNIEPRDATDGEVSRIKGGLDRMEISYVRSFIPELTDRYIQQARRTLRKAYGAGDRDPRLMAEIGLCECDAGDDEAARPFLVAATRQKVVRPRAYFELARIDFTALLARTPAGRFTAEEVSDVLHLLSMARRQSPQLPEVYEMVAEIWLRTDAGLSAAQFAVLDEGVRNFQWRTRLIYSAALLNSLHGRPAEALALVERGLAVSGTPKEREHFLKLKSALTAPATPPKS